MELNPADIKIETFRGGGCKDVTMGASAVRITHLPTGTVITSDKHKSYYMNKNTAMRDLTLELRKLK